MDLNEDFDPLLKEKRQESDYHKQRLNQTLNDGGYKERMKAAAGATNTNTTTTTPPPTSTRTEKDSNSKKSRWDDTPSSNIKWDATPALASNAQTPKGNSFAETPIYSLLNHSASFISDADLDALFPSGYSIVPVPDSYIPIRTPARKLASAPTPNAGFMMQQDADYGASIASEHIPQGMEGQLNSFNQNDAIHFSKLLDNVNEDDLPIQELKERKIMKLLLKIKNGTPQSRKYALKHLTEHARDFGAGPLLNQILPLFMSADLDPSERHVLVKVIDRVLFKLDDLVRPFVGKILVVLMPLLIDEDYFVRIEGRELISNLAKAAGLASMVFNN